MADKENLSTPDELDEADKPITARQLNQALTNYRRQIEKDMQKVLQGVQAATSPKEETVKDETLTLREQIKALQEKDRQRDSQLKQELLNKSVRDNLSKSGIDSRYLDFAYKAVRDDISWDVDGTLVMKDSFGVNVPLSEGLASWAKSEGAGIFRAAKEVSGSGAQPARNGTPNLPSKPANPAEAPKTVTDAKAALIAALRNGSNLTGR